MSDANSDLDRLWGRQASLLVGSASTTIDLSQMHFRFDVNQSDILTPNTMTARVYNLDDTTVNLIKGANGAKSEYTRVVLQAGYFGNSGVIFDGTIKQIATGKENNTDTFLDIFAAEWDVPYTFATVNTTLAAGATLQDQCDANARSIVDQFGTPMQTAPNVPELLGTGGILPRGKVLFGMSKDYFRTIGQTSGTTISVQGDQIIAVPLTGYLPAQVVVLNSQTGLIGVPESTQQGVVATSLLNPKIQIGTRVQINNNEINQTLITNVDLQAISGGLAFYATVAGDGIYRVAVIDYEGDTRGIAWYSKITALAVDPSAAPANSVQQFG